jgi:hypothetical protein
VRLFGVQRLHEILYQGSLCRVQAVAILVAAVAALGFEWWRVEWGRRAVQREVDRHRTWELEQTSYRFSPLRPLDRLR